MQQNNTIGYYDNHVEKGETTVYAFFLRFNVKIWLCDVDFGQDKIVIKEQKFVV